MIPHQKAVRGLLGPLHSFLRPSYLCRRIHAAMALETLSLSLGGNPAVCPSISSLYRVDKGTVPL